MRGWWRARGCKSKFVLLSYSVMHCCFGRLNDRIRANCMPRERAAINLQLISDLCDLTVPTSALGWVNLDDGIVGLAGTVSSLIGVYGAWKKTA